MNRPASSIAMLLPTILATLFMFTVVITLNKASSLSRGGKIVRLISVDDMFPSLAEAEAMREKAYYELPPPPSPEAVLGTPAEQEIPTLQEPPLEPDFGGRLSGNLSVDRWWSAFEPESAPPTAGPDTSMPISLPPTAPRLHGISQLPTDIPLPAVTLDTSLPPPAPAPVP